MSRIPDLDFTALAALFSRAYAQTGNIEDALRVYEAARAAGHAHNDIGAACLNQLVASVSESTGRRVRDILGRSQHPHDVEARLLVWHVLHRRHLTTRAIAAAFKRSHSRVVEGLQRFERMLEASAELRSRVVWSERGARAAG